MTDNGGPASGVAYSIFLSHNRVDKTWARGFWELLRNAELRVFFDAESIPPGTNFVKAISTAI